MTEHILTPSDVPPKEPIRVAPCPFCGGPPVPTDDLGETAIDTEQGTWVCAHVWCHECGAEGPSCQTLIYERAELWGLLTRAVELWNQRDQRDIDLYCGGEARGLNKFPRPDGHGSPV